MFDSGVFELIVVLLGIYLSLGLVTSYVNDMIASLLHLRSQNATAGIQRMLGLPQLAEKVFQNLRVQNFADKEGRVFRNLPPEVFTQALLDTIAPEGKVSPSNDDLRNAVMAMPNSPAKWALREILEDCPDDRAGARRGISEWFDREMDYAATIYSRRIQWISLFVAVVLTFLFGIDTFAIASYFLQKNALSAAIAAAAQTYAAQSNPLALQELARASLPIGWGTFPSTIHGWLDKIPGLGISALAVALSAPLSYGVRAKLLPRLFSVPTNVSVPLENLRKAQPGQVQEIAASQILLLNEYQNQVLSEQNRSFLYALVAAATGLGFFLTAITFLLLRHESDAALVSALAGAIVEVISGINFYLYAQTSAQVALFHARLDMTQRFLLANSMCDTLKDNYKEEARSALVRAIATAEPMAQASPKPNDEKKKTDRADN